MNKIIIVIAFTSVFVSCKKASTSPIQNTSSNIIDTTKYITDGIVSIGKPIGKIGSGVYDINGNKYKSVIIGSQEWMAENLKVSKFNDGTTIPNEVDRVKWFNLNTGAWSNYKNDKTLNEKYGKLYNGYVVNQSYNGNKNVCPTGWHVPTVSEWETLKNYTAVGSTGWGKTLSETDTLSWVSPNKNSTNTTLFTALPGGRRNMPASSNGVLLFDNSPDFDAIKLTGFWWSSTNNQNEENSRVYLSSNNNFYVGGTGNFTTLKNGYSIRCLKD